MKRRGEVMNLDPMTVQGQILLHLMSFSYMSAPRCPPPMPPHFLGPHLQGNGGRRRALVIVLGANLSSMYLMGGTHMLRHTGDVLPKWVTFSPKILRHGSHFGQKILRGGSHFTKFAKKNGKISCFWGRKNP